MNRARIVRTVVAMRILVVVAVVVAAMASGCAAGSTFGRTARATRIVDASVLLVSNAMLMADAAYTTSVASQRWPDGRREVGMPAAQLMGQTPSPGAVMAYFGGAVLINTALWLALPPRWRSIVPGIVIGAQADALLYNYGVCRSC